MAREKEGYRDALERIRHEAAGEMVTVAEAAHIPASKVHIVPQGKPGTNIIERYVLDDVLTLDDITYNGDGSVASLRVRKRDGSVITWQAS